MAAAASPAEAASLAEMVRIEALVFLTKGLCSKS
jgi:hypothetical protein